VQLSSCGVVAISSNYKHPWPFGTEMVKRYLQLQAEDLQNHASHAFAAVDYQLSRVFGLTSMSFEDPSKQAWCLIGETEVVDLLFLTGLSAMSTRKKNWSINLRETGF
jgi:hypothetical protein